MKICLNCGDTLLDQAKKCPTCGNKANFISVDPSGKEMISEIIASVPNPKAGLQPKWANAYVFSGSTTKPSKRTVEKERIKENKANGVACCPKCGSTSLSSSKKGFGFGKAAVGVWALGVPGAIAGVIGSKKVEVTCLNCGHRWKI